MEFLVSLVQLFIISVIGVGCGAITLVCGGLVVKSTTEHDYSLAGTLCIATSVFAGIFIAMLMILTETMVNVTICLGISVSLLIVGIIFVSSSWFMERRK